MIQGTTYQELLETVWHEHNSTGTKKYLSENPHIIIEGSLNDDGLENWTLRDIGKRSEKKKVGKNFSTLENLLTDVSETASSNMLNVLCLVSATKKGDDVETSWINVNPLNTCQLKDGAPQFNTMAIQVKESDLNKIMETRIAFYDESLALLYPITNAAEGSLSRILDTSSVFKKLPSVPLGSALFLAERLSVSKGVTFIYKNADKNNNVKPLIGVAGFTYSQQFQLEFLRNCMNYMALKCSYEPTSWAIQNGVATVDLKVQSFTAGITPIIRVVMSDIPGIPMSVSALLKVGKGELLLVENKGKEKDDIETFFNDVFERINLTTDMVLSMQTSVNKVSFKPGYLKDIAKAIGKKRAEMVVIPVKPMERFALFEEIVNQSYCSSLGEKQDRMLKIAYTNLLCAIQKEEEDEMVA